jgi:hypothetical protein
MKKFLDMVLVVAAVLCILGAFPSEADASDNSVTVEINGAAVQFADQAPIIVDGRTLVPVRGVFEMLGFDVSWNNENQTATLINDDYTVALTIDSVNFTTNGTMHTLDVPAQIINGRTMLPIRAVVESVGLFMEWTSETQTVKIYTSSIAQALQEFFTDEELLGRYAQSMENYLQIAGYPYQRENRAYLVDVDGEGT